jgi:probable F420-dependent oxidoreductase
MQIGVVFPNVMYREGQEGVAKLIRGIEAIGFDELAMFDHVVMGYPTQTRRAPFYTPTMPIMEAFSVLAFAAGITSTIGLGTGVLVLPQRQPTLVARQAASIDTLSNGRLRLGVGIGWQRSEYQALGEDFANRGARLEESVALLRAYWGNEHVSFDGVHYQVDEMAFEPKPPQGQKLPIWVGGTKPVALRRIAKIADGWMAMRAPGDDSLEEQVARFQDYVAAAGRDLKDVPMQMSLSPGALDKDKRKRFYAEPEMLRDRIIELKALGFTHTTLDCVPLFQLGYRSSDALLEHLEEIYRILKPALDAP